MVMIPPFLLFPSILTWVLAISSTSEEDCSSMIFFSITLKPIRLFPLPGEEEEEEDEGERCIALLIIYYFFTSLSLASQIFSWLQDKLKTFPLRVRAGKFISLFMDKQGMLEIVSKS